MYVSEVSPAFAQALIQVQGSIEGAKKGKVNPAFRSKYADLGACWDACREALQTAGIAVLQFPCGAAPGNIGLRTVLVFGKTGETLSEDFCLPLKDPTSPQAAGSAITYARRYALCSVVGICPEDDDGNKASQESRSQPKQSSKSIEKTVDQLMEEFNELSTNDERRKFFIDVKQSSVPEPHKTVVLMKISQIMKPVMPVKSEKELKEGQK